MERNTIARNIGRCNNNDCAVKTHHNSLINMQACLVMPAEKIQSFQTEKL